MEDEEEEEEEEKADDDLELPPGIPSVKESLAGPKRSVEVLAERSKPAPQSPTQLAPRILPSAIAGIGGPGVAGSLEPSYSDMRLNPPLQNDGLASEHALSATGWRG